MCTCEICVLLAALLEPLCMYLVSLSIKDASRHDAEPHIVRTSSARTTGSACPVSQSRRAGSTRLESSGLRAARTLGLGARGSPRGAAARP